MSITAFAKSRVKKIVAALLASTTLGGAALAQQAPRTVEVDGVTNSAAVMQTGRLPEGVRGRQGTTQSNFRGVAINVVNRAITDEQYKIQLFLEAVYAANLRDTVNAEAVARTNGVMGWYQEGGQCIAVHGIIRARQLRDVSRTDISADGFVARWKPTITTLNAPCDDAEITETVRQRVNALGKPGSVGELNSLSDPTPVAPPPVQAAPPPPPPPPVVETPPPPPPPPPAPPAPEVPQLDRGWGAANADYQGDTGVAKYDNFDGLTIARAAAGYTVLGTPGGTSLDVMASASATKSGIDTYQAAVGGNLGSMLSLEAGIGQYRQSADPTIRGPFNAIEPNTPILRREMLESFTAPDGLNGSGFQVSGSIHNADRTNSLSVYAVQGENKGEDWLKAMNIGGAEFEGFGVTGNATVGPVDLFGRYDQTDTTYTGRPNEETVKTIEAGARLNLGERARITGTYAQQDEQNPLGNAGNIDVSKNSVWTLGGEYDLTSRFTIGGEYGQHNANMVTRDAIINGKPLETDFSADTYALYARYAVTDNVSLKAGVSHTSGGEDVQVPQVTPGRPGTPPTIGVREIGVHGSDTTFTVGATVRFGNNAGLSNAQIASREHNQNMAAIRAEVEAARAQSAQARAAAPALSAQGQANVDLVSSYVNRPRAMRDALGNEVITTSPTAALNAAVVPAQQTTQVSLNTGCTQPQQPIAGRFDPSVDFNRNSTCKGLITPPDYSLAPASQPAPQAAANENRSFLQRVLRR